MAGVTFLIWMSLAADVSAARVTLHGHRGELDVSTGTPQLRFELKAQNNLPVPVREIEVGILFAGAEAALKDIDAGKLYQSEAQAGRQVGALRVHVAVELPAQGEAPVVIHRPLAAGEPEPRAFRTHVLGYRLAALSAPLLLELLASEVAADEVAVVDTLALAGTAAEKRTARKQWAQTPNLVAALVEQAGADPGSAPSHALTLRRVFAVRALGVLGGEQALSALKGLLRDPRLNAFDEPLQVLRVARVVGSPLETPMAYAVPPHAHRMHDVVAAALDDAVGPREDPPPAPTRATGDSGHVAAPSQTPPDPPPPAPQGAPQIVAVADWTWVALIGAAAFLLAALALRMARRRHPRPPQS